MDFIGLKVGKISKMTEFNYYYTQVSVLVICLSNKIKIYIAHKLLFIK